MAHDTQVKTTYAPPMNRGHVYLEMWYWLLDRIEAEQDSDKRSAMNAVNLVMQGGIDNNSLAVQYDCAMKAIDTANKLGLSLISANLQALTHDALYSDYQPHPVVEAQAIEREIDEALRNRSELRWGNVVFDLDAMGENARQRSAELKKRIDQRRADAQARRKADEIRALGGEA